MDGNTNTQQTRGDNQEDRNYGVNRQDNTGLESNVCKIRN